MHRVPRDGDTRRCGIFDFEFCPLYRQQDPIIASQLNCGPNHCGRWAGSMLYENDLCVKIQLTLVQADQCRLMDDSYYKDFTKTSCHGRQQYCWRLFDRLHSIHDLPIEGQSALMTNR